MDQPSLPPAPSMPAGPSSPEPPPRSHVGRNVAIAVLVLVLAAAGFVVAARMGSGQGRQEASPSSSPSPSPMPPAKPLSFRSHATASSIALSWKPGDGGSDAAAYAIDRNGDRVVTVKAYKTSWVDPHLPPGHTYHYSIRAVDAAGEYSTVATIVATTKTLPTYKAPIDGVFNVRLTATSHYGFSSFGSNHAVQGWRMATTCGAPCTVAVHDTHISGFDGKLTQHGTTYSGSLRSKGFASCNGTDAYSDVTINLHVTKAKFVDGKWRAVGFEGTMLVRTAPQLGCIASGIDDTLSGRYYG